MNPKKNRKNYYAEEVSAIEAAEFCSLKTVLFLKLKMACTFWAMLFTLIGGVRWARKDLW